MTDKLEKLERLLPELPAAVDRQRLGDRLTSATQALREAEHHARRLRALLLLAAELDYGARSDQAEIVAVARREALELSEAFAEADDDESLRAAVYDYEKSFIVALGSLERGVRQHWRTTLADQFQPLIGFGELLAKIDGVADLGRRLADCARRALKSDTGPADQLLIQVQTLLAEYKSLQAERAAAIAADDVGEFLNALADRRATLAMITPAVDAWLRKQQALGRFAVSPL